MPPTTPDLDAITTFTDAGLIIRITAADLTVVNSDGMATADDLGAISDYIRADATRYAEFGEGRDIFGTGAAILRDWESTDSPDTFVFCPSDTGTTAAMLVRDFQL